MQIFKKEKESKEEEKPLENQDRMVNERRFRVHPPTLASVAN